jgi:polysaccharide export outer membrane protein
LSVQVYGQTDLSQTDILVREDGRATFNNIGELQVAGRTVADVEADVREHLSELFVKPIVTLNIVQTRPGVIYLSGAVMHPGMYQLNTSQSKNAVQQQPVTRIDMRLTNVLTNAGGVTLAADLSRVQIKRSYTGIQENVNLWNVLKHASADEDVWLQSGDSVYVPERTTATISDEDYKLLLSSTIGPTNFVVRVVGQVGTPGLVQLDSRSPYLDSAIASVGGYKVDANRSAVIVRRFTGPNTFDTFKVDINQQDLLLKPNDVVFVPEQGFFKTARYFEAVGRILQPFVLAITPFYVF